MRALGWWRHRTALRWDASESRSEASRLLGLLPPRSDWHRVAIFGNPARKSGQGISSTSSISSIGSMVDGGWLGGGGSAPAHPVERRHCADPKRRQRNGCAAERESNGFDHHTTTTTTTTAISSLPPPPPPPASLASYTHGASIAHAAGVAAAFRRTPLQPLVPA